MDLRGRHVQGGVRNLPYQFLHWDFFHHPHECRQIPGDSARNFGSKGAHAVLWSIGGCGHMGGRAPVLFPRGGLSTSTEL